MTAKRFTLKESDIYNRNDVIHDNGIELPQSTACDLLNELHEENTHIKNTIQTMKNNERTQIGQSVLQQLWEQIQC